MSNPEIKVFDDDEIDAGSAAIAEWMGVNMDDYLYGHLAERTPELMKALSPVTL